MKRQYVIVSSLYNCASKYSHKVRRTRCRILGIRDNMLVVRHPDYPGVEFFAPKP